MSMAGVECGSDKFTGCPGIVLLNADGAPCSMTGADRS